MYVCMYSFGGGGVGGWGGGVGEWVGGWGMTYYNNMFIQYRVYGRWVVDEEPRALSNHQISLYL